MIKVGGMVFNRALIRAAVLTIIFWGLVGAAQSQTNLAVKVKYAPSVNGIIEGSVWQFQGEGLNFNSGATITGSLLVPGTPNVTFNGSPTFGGTLTNTGSASPSGYWVTLNSGSTLGHLVTRTDAGTLTSVATPPASTGTRSVYINTSGDSAGDFSTLKNLTLNGGGVFFVPPGTYNTFSANSGTGFLLGETNGTTTAIYSFQSLNLNGSASIQVVGPVEIRVKNGFSANGSMGTSAHPEWLIIKISNGGFNFNSAYTMYGHLIAPNGTVMINSGCTIAGTVEADRLTVNSGGKLQWAPISGGSNQMPTANAQSVSTAEDTAVAITLTGSDPESSPLTYTVVSGPSHGTLSGTAPNLTYSPATNYFGADSFTFKVNDGTVDSGTATVSITVTAVNDAPVLAAIANYTVAEETAFSLTNAVTDVDSSVFTFMLGTNAPAGMSINASTGVITWTPDEAQGPSTNVVSVTVTDNGSPALSETKGFTVTVLEVNTAPVLTAIANRTLFVGQLLTVTNSATDSDIPANLLTYSLGTNTPAGMTITDGVITWTPGMPNGNTTNVINVTVTDNGVPPFSDTKIFTVTVLATNHAPVLAGISNQVVAEGELLTVVPSASDVDGDALTYTLSTNAPPGMSINSTNGVISWAPNEAQGPSTNVVSVMVTDNGSLALSDTKSFTITVLEVNAAPVMFTPANQVVVEGNLLVVTNSATDADIPTNALTFSLGTNAPAGMAIDPMTGILTWTPGMSQSPSTNVVTVAVTDNGVPPLGTNVSFLVTVLATNHAPVFGAMTNSVVYEFQWVQNVAVATDVDGDALTYSLGTNAPSWMSINATNGFITMLPGELDGGTTNIVTLVVTDNGTPNLSTTRTFEVRVLESNFAPVLTVMDQMVIEGHQLVVTNSVTDTDIPANSFIFTIDTNAPAGLSINPTNGVITWTPTEEQGSSTNNILVTVTDDGDPAFSDTKAMQIIVLEENTAPVLAVITNHVVTEMQFLLVTNILASDVDVPTNKLSFSLGAGAPTWMQIHGTNGMIFGTPAESDGPSTNLISVIVTDDGVPSMSATQTFVLTVLEINERPIFGGIQDQTVSEGQLLIVTNTATDVDLPANVLTYTLGTNSPPGMLMNPTNAVITWTPGEEYGGTVMMRVQYFVTDNGVPPETAEGGFWLNILEVNEPPVLAPIADQTIVEGLTLTITNSASDSDLPVNVLTYSLGSAAPGGMSINPTNGVISWTPSEAQGPSTNLISVIVTDDGVPSMSATQTFTVFVLETNSSPSLVAVPNQTVVEGELLSVTNIVVDADIPANSFAFSLGSSAPVGMSINATNGIITWTPSEAQGPSTNAITVIVADDGSPVLWATNTFVVTVLEANSAPVLAAIPNQSVTEHQLLSLTVTATDVDLPMNGLAFSLGSGAPAGMSINAGSGIITWTPTEAQGPSTNWVSVIVTDDGVPSLSATQSFTVVVLESNSAPILAAPATQSIDEGQFLVVMSNATDMDIPANVLTYGFGAGAQAGMAIDAQTGVITWTPNELQGPSTNVIEIIVTDNGVPPMSTNVFLTVTVREVNSAPTLVALPVQSVMAGQLLSVTNFANDADYPANVLTFSLVTNELTGIAINPTNGVVTWVPGESFAGLTNMVRVTVTDDGVPSLSATQSLFIYVPPLNTAPVITLVTNFTGEAGSVIFLTAQVTDDGRPFGGYLTNHWELVSGAGQMVISNANTLTASAIFASAGEYVFRFTSNDGELESSALTTVNVAPRNEAPRVSAGPNQFARLPATVTLLGYAADDGYPVGGSLTVQWTQTSGPAAVSFDDTSSTNSTVSFPVVGDYILRLTASDSVLTNYSEVKVGVRNALTNQPPAVYAGPDIKAGLSTAVVMAGVVTDDGLPTTNTLTVQWSKVSGPGEMAFDLTDAPGTLATFSTNGVYVLRLTATDGEYTVTDDVQVSIFATNLPPEVDAGPDLTLLVPDPSVLTAGGLQPRDVKTELATSLFGQAKWNTKPGQPGLNYGVAVNGLSYSGKYLFATGPYEYAGTNFVGGVARWDGTNWSALFDERPLDPIDPMSPPFGLVTYDYRYTGANDSRGEEIYVTASFLKDVMGVGGGNLTARWDGTNWVGWAWHGQSSYVSVSDIMMTKDAVYVGGSFIFQPTNAFAGGSGVTFTNLPVSYGIAKWTGEHWTNLADGIRTYSDSGAPDISAGGNVKVMAEGKHGEIYVAGSFEMSTPYGGATNIAMWNGTNWAPLGGGISGCYRFACHPTINAMAVDDDGNLYVGGDIAVAGNISVRSIAMWDGGNWHALGTGPQNGVQGEVLAIVTHGRDVYVSGIGEAGGVVVNAVARWNGEFWSPLGSGNTNGVFYSVAAMTVAPEGVYVGGVFSSAGGQPSDCIALWEFPPEPERFVRLNGRVTDDGLPYAGSLSQYWSKVSGPGEVIFANTNSAVTTASFTALGTYVLQLTANDTEYTVLDELTVEVKGNLPPVVNAGDDVVARLNEVVTLDGSVTDDGLPENFVPISQWTQLSGPVTVFIDKPTQPRTYAEFTQAGTYTFRLKANDSQFSRYDDVTVVITGPNLAPGATITGLTTGNLVTPVSLNGNPSDDGLPNGVLSYQWSKVSGPGTVSFSSATLASTTVGFSQAGTYVISFAVSDSELTTRAEKTIQVSNFSSSRPFVYVGCPLSVEAGQPIVLPGVMESQTGGATITWEVWDGPGTVTFSDEHALRPTVTFSQAGAYELALYVEDGIGDEFQTLRVLVTSSSGGPSGVNAAPVIQSMAPFWVFASTNFVPLTAVVLDDGQPIGQPVTWAWSQLSGPGSVLFYPASGTLLGTNVQALATFSQPGAYTLQLTASDSEYTVSKTVQLRVTELSSVGTPYDQNYTGGVYAGPDATVALGTTYITQAGGSNYYGARWTVVSGPGRAEVFDPYNSATEVSFSAAGVYQLRWSGQSFSGPVQDDVLITVTSASNNRGPVVDAGPSVFFYAPQSTATLSGSFMDDGLPTGGNVTYEWVLEYGDTPVTIENPNSLTTQVTFEGEMGEYSYYWFKLIVHDGELTSENFLSIAVVDPNIDWWIPANVQIMPGQTVESGAGVKLTATADMFNTWSAFVEWQQISGPIMVSADDWYSEQPTVKLLIPGTYVFRAVVWGDVMVSDTVTITVTDPANRVPLVDAGPRVRYFLFNERSATLSGTASDDGVPSNGALTVHWQQVSGPSQALLASPDSLITQVYAVRPGIYTFRLDAFDGEKTASSTVELEVIEGVYYDFFNAPLGVDAGPDADFPLGGTYASNISVNGFNFAIQWEQVSGPVNVPINSGFNMSANLSVAGTYVFRVIVSNNSFIAYDDVSVTVGTNGVVNAAPYVWSGNPNPLIAGQLSQLRMLVADDCALANPVISVHWELDDGQSGVTFGNTTITNSTLSPNVYEVLTDAVFDQPGYYWLLFRASDGEATSETYNVLITVVAPTIPNQAPFEYAGQDISGVAQLPLGLSGYAWDDGLPTGSVLQTGWSQVTGPAPIYFANSAATNTTVTALVPGTYVLRLTATDGQKSSFDDVTVTIYEAENVEPFVFAGYNFSVTRPQAANLQGIVVDDGLLAGYPLEIEWSKISGPGSVAFGSLTNPITTATFSATGTYVLRLTAYDGDLLGFDEVTVTVLQGMNEAPVVEAGSDVVTTVGSITPLSGYATDDGLPNGFLQPTWSQVSGPGTAHFTWLNGVYRVSFPDEGTYVLRFTATDGVLSSSDELTVTVHPPTPAPLVEITTPEDATEVTAPTTVTGTASSPLLAYYVLEYRPVSTDGGNAWTMLASNTVSVVNGPLGALDPTLSLNGIYELRLRAADTLGRTSVTDPVSVIFDRNMKIGNFAFSFNDLTIPVAGIPITITRSYDSRNKETGDFGVGWTMDINNIRLQKNRHLGINWEQTVEPGLFPVYGVRTSKSRVVTITFPSGKTYKFGAVPNPSAQFGIPLIYPRMKFLPYQGTYGTLTPLVEIDGELYPDDQVVYNGDFPGFGPLLSYELMLNPPVGAADNIIFNPDLFEFKTLEGYSYIISETNGLRSVTDPNGNTLTITRDGLIHSAGKSVFFERDVLGRITNIVDAAGNAMQYEYDAEGNLQGYRDREGNVTSFNYDGKHNLLSVVDPRGITPAQNEYDANGRLIRHIDAYGKVVEYTHNLGDRQEVVTDRLGNVTVMEYDGRGNVIASTAPDGGVTLSSYDADDNLLTVTDPLGRTMTYTYDADGNRTSVTDPLGNITSLTYGEKRRVTSVTDPRGNTVLNTFDAKGNLLVMRDPQGNTVHFGYNSKGLPTAMTNALGHVSRWSYDDTGYLVQETDPTGRLNIYTNDIQGNPLSMTTTRTTPSGLQTLTVRFAYDGQNRLTNVVYPDGSTTRTIFNDIGKPAVSIDQLGRQTVREYDELGRVKRVIYADGTSEANAFDVEGRLLATTNRLGQVTQFRYDSVGRLVSSIAPDGSSGTNWFNLAGQVVASTDPRGNSTFFGYDVAGRTIAVTNALGQVSRTFYDEAGNVTNMVDNLGRSTQFLYDELNRRIQTLFADGTTQNSWFDSIGRRVASADQAGITTWFGYDAGNRLTSVTNAMGFVTRYAYDELGQQISQTDANNHTTTYEYDLMGRRTKRRLPGNQVESYAYDIAGRVLGRTDFNGYTTTYQYDLMSRLLARVPDARLFQAPISFEYNALGMRTNMTDVSGVTTYEYDNRNRLIKKSTAAGTLHYTYDVNGNVTSTHSENANGINVTYEYDLLNRLERVNDSHTGATVYNYDGVGNLRGYTYPNGVNTYHEYDSLNRLTNLTSGRVLTAVAGYAYTLGAAGNRLTAQETVVRPGGPTTINRIYTYDALYRLTGESITVSAQTSTLGYTYDAVGNRLTRSSGIPSLPWQNFGYDANDRLTSDTYDANGNTLNGRQGTGQSMGSGYDFEDRLTSATTASGGVGIVYDGDGNRVRKTVNGVTTWYLVDDLNPTGYAQVLEEHVSSVTQPLAINKVYTYGHSRISMDQVIGNQWEVSFYGYDGHGNVRYLTDEQGAVTDTYDYDAFGNLIARTGTTPNSYLFTGEQYDEELGLYYLRARYHNPDSGRFWSMDSFEGFGSDPASLHKYTYCHNNPVNMIDPSGHHTLNEVLMSTAFRSGLVGGAFGAISAGYTAYAHNGYKFDSGVVQSAGVGFVTGFAFGYMFGSVPAAVWSTPSGLWTTAILSSWGLTNALEEWQAGYGDVAAMQAAFALTPVVLTPSQLARLMQVRYTQASDAVLDALSTIKSARLRFGISKTKTIAVAEVNIPGIEPELIAASGKHTHEGAIPGQDFWTFEWKVVTYARVYDAEFKLLEFVSQRITTSTKGEITMYVEKPACDSCASVITQFRARHPNVKLTVVEVPAQPN